MIIVDIYRRLRAATLGTWLLFFTPLFIFFALVLRIGPALTFFSSTALNNRASSIYDAAFRDELIQFVSLAHWLGDALNAQIMGIAAGVTIATVSAKTLRGGAVMAGLATFALWTVSDVCWVLLGRDETSLVPAISANFIGGFLLSLIVFPILCLYNYLGRESLKTKSIKALFPIAAVSLGVLISATAHTILTFVYEPIPARVDAILSAPASGAFDAAPSPNRAAPESLRRDTASLRLFRFLPPNAPAREAVVGNVLGHPRLTWRGTGAERYTVEIAFFGDCSRDSDIARLSMPSARFLQRDISGLDLDFGDELTHFFILNNEGSRFTADAGRIAGYAMEVGDGIRLESLSSFRRDQANLKVDTRLPFSFYVGGIMGLSQRTASQSVRTLTVRLGGPTRAIRFERATSVRGRGRPRTCRPLQAGSGSSLPPRVTIGNDYVGALVRISRAAESISDDMAYAGEVVVAGSHGWLTISGIDYGQIHSRDLGALSAIEMSGNGMRLRVDGQAIEVSPHSTIAVRGDLKGRLGENGDRYISGWAEAILNDGTRINSTRWERLAVELQIFAISSVAAIVLALATLLKSTFARLKKDEPLYYYP